MKKRLRDHQKRITTTGFFTYCDPYGACAREPQGKLLVD